MYLEELKNKIKERLEMEDLAVYDSTLEQIAEIYCEMANISIYAEDMETAEINDELLISAIGKFKRFPASSISDTKNDLNQTEFYRTSSIAIDEYGQSDIDYEEGRRR